MAERIPLIVDSTTSTIKELAADDVLTTSGSGFKPGITTITVNSAQTALTVTQTGSGDALLIEDETSPDASPFFVSGIGSVGVGTTTPVAKLTVSTDDETPGIEIIQNNPSTSTFPLVIRRGDVSQNEPLLRVSGVGSVGLGTTSSALFTVFKSFNSGAGAGYTQGFGFLQFTSGTPSDRRVGLMGTHVPNDGSGPYNWAPSHATTTFLIGAQGTTDAGIGTTAADYYYHNVSLGLNNQDPRGLNKQHSANAYMTLTTSENTQTLYQGGKLDFYVRANTAPYSFPNNPYVWQSYWMTSIMTIQGEGRRVGIGTSLPSERFQVVGTMKYDNRPSAASVTALGVDASGIVRESSSSRRFKENIEVYNKGLADVANLNPVTFNYIGEDDVTLGGLIAEEVHDAGLTEFVIYEEDKETPKAINYGHMIALMTNAVKDLKEENESLRSEIAAIKAHLNL